MKAIWGSALILAMACGLSAPASAQVGLGFDFRFGDRATSGYPQRALCLTDRQIREAIAQRGYTNIALNVSNERRIQVRGVKDGWVQLIDFDFCSDRVRGVTMLRPAR